MKTRLFLRMTLFLMLFSLQNFYGQKHRIELQQLFGKENVTYIDSSAFKEYYRINVRQPINHNNTQEGFFEQQVLLGIQDPKSITILQTAGYAIPKHFNNPNYKTELTAIVNGNQVLIEHRYFGSSIPDSLTKQFLTYEQASNDDHFIKEKLARLLTGKWISTGISKSGDAALAYRFYYPNDVDATVAFGISITTEAEDPRFETYIKERRKTEDGKKINEAQLYLLKNKKKLLPLFRRAFEFENQDFENWDLETLYDYGVLDLEVSFWQYYKSFDDFKLEVNTIFGEESKREGFPPTLKLDTFEDRLVLFVAYSSIGLIDKKMTNHYYQAFSQGGYYGYEETPFLKYLKLKDYPLSVFALEPTLFKGKFRQDEKKWSESKMDKVIFINGDNDPWAVYKIKPAKDLDNLQVMVHNANHTLKLKDLPNEDYKNVILKLNKWLDLNLDVNRSSDESQK